MRTTHWDYYHFRNVHTSTCMLSSQITLFTNVHILSHFRYARQRQQRAAVDIQPGPATLQPASVVIKSEQPAPQPAPIVPQAPQPAPIYPQTPQPALIDPQAPQPVPINPQAHQPALIDLKQLYENSQHRLSSKHLSQRWMIPNFYYSCPSQP